ncbi:hypothetical protein BDP27DRAFT_1324269 [Rhodocollybia butyracea]|uniref:Uncharacterized protein n=1 Tax=Rhodocollybia butyracea TaxID=206335 RepID=A0A9P5PVV6_9AGAR|nr:hypothetical protein BDP27DRAFT_1324269 [Rhodocollybia butyracea]
MVCNRQSTRLSQLLKPNRFTSRKYSSDVRRVPASTLLTALHKVTSVFPRVYYPITYELEFLESLSQQVSQTPPAATIAVLGSKNNSNVGTEELVTALLDQPFSSSEVNEALRKRWEMNSKKKKIIIAFGSTIEWSSTPSSPHSSSTSEPTPILYLPSAFLSSFPFPVQIHEYGPRDDVVNQDTYAIDHLHYDVPIVVTTSLSTISDDVLNLPEEETNSNSLVVCNPVGYEGETAIRHKVLYADPMRAVRGLDTVRQVPQAIQQYQDEFVGSRVPSVISYIKDSLAPFPDLETLRIQRITSHLSSVLSRMSRSIKDNKLCADHAMELTGKVLEEFEVETVGKVRKEVLGVWDSSVLKQEKSDENHVSKALAFSTRQMQPAMDRLTWWRMLAHIDELNVVVNRAVEENCCRELEQELIFHSGRLSSLQAHFTESVFKVMDEFNRPRSPWVNTPFGSSVLYNSLKQVASSSSYTLSSSSSSSLIAPIHTRKAQLAAYSTTRLHIAAQQVALGMGASAAAGAGLGWAAWFEFLNGTGAASGLLVKIPFLPSDPATLGALALLVAVTGIRWGVGKWARAKRAWWDDWRRVGEGLERDLEANLNHTLQTQIGILPRMAHEGISEIANKMKEEADGLMEEIEGIKTDLKERKRT